MISTEEMEALHRARVGKQKSRALPARYYFADPSELAEFESEKARKASIIAKVRADMKMVNKIFKGK